MTKGVIMIEAHLFNNLIYLSLFPSSSSSELCRNTSRQKSHQSVHAGIFYLSDCFICHRWSSRELTLGVLYNRVKLALQAAKSVKGSQGAQQKSIQLAQCKS